MSDLGLTARKTCSRRMGASRYLCYPEHTVYNGIEKRVLEADFVGKNYITGRGEPFVFRSGSLMQKVLVHFRPEIKGKKLAVMGNTRTGIKELLR